MPSYDEAQKSFSGLLHWHLVNGTRPSGDKANGREWGNKEFAGVLKHGLTEKAVRNWRAGRNLPRLLDHIERALFGDEVTPQYATWRSDLRAAYAAAADRDKGSFRPNQEITLGSTSSTQQSASTKDDYHSYDRELKSIIYALEHHHTNPEGIFWIGQTLVQCRSFLRRNGNSGSASSIVESLLIDIDEDTRSKEGVFDVFISPRKIADLIDELTLLEKSL
jgi:hypothetical protein